jgi:hypothetical protein
MDLTTGVPRSPYETLGGIVFLPRAIDKMRAHLTGTKGAYNSHTGTSGRLCRFLFGITAEEFEAIVRAAPTDEGVLEALRRRVPFSPDDVEDWNQLAINGVPHGEADWAQHWQRLQAAGHGDRRDIVTQFDRLDLDEGRAVPTGGRWAPWLRAHNWTLVERIRARREAAHAQA